MRKFRLWIWSIVLLSVVVTIGLMLISPQTIVLHFSGTGAADSWGGRWGLWLSPVILIVVGAICDQVAVHQRKRDGLLALPAILVGEWRNILLMGMIFVVCTWLQLKQIGL
ncbi:DUF1648 domain-containing protein [Lacticaseibacillus porcinae]|uniref:DUF1648 domain-containing protein n=1 Tax=Lacticaseibacillus porcinae TaxID=1123687 RepID=UPI0013DE4C2D|nr:DUF1648 domain-containing protein [Lacticaseibacillus porcinae]